MEKENIEIERIEKRLHARDPDFICSKTIDERIEEMKNEISQEMKEIFHVLNEKVNKRGLEREEGKLKKIKQELQRIKRELEEL